MHIEINNTNQSKQRLMVVSSNQNTFSDINNVKDLVARYESYDMQQPPLSREYAELEENTDGILDFLGIDADTRIMFQSYDAKTNTDKAIAAQVRALAGHLMGRSAAGEDITFPGTDSHDKAANIVGCYQENPDSNPTLELKWYINDVAHFDSGNVIEDSVGKAIDATDDAVLELTDIHAIVVEENDGTSYLFTQEEDGLTDAQWAEVVAYHIQALNEPTVYCAIAEYSR